MYSRSGIVVLVDAGAALSAACPAHPSNVFSSRLCFCVRSWSTICLLQLWPVSFDLSQSMARGAYYRLGKKRPCSGILSRYSRFALTIQAMPTRLATTRPMAAVFAFQLCGWAYQPPDGDQTCLGYLRRSARRQWQQQQRAPTGSCLRRP
jgi:hypothetical protein